MRWDSEGAAAEWWERELSTKLNTGRITDAEAAVYTTCCPPELTTPRFGSRTWHLSIINEDGEPSLYVRFTPPRQPNKYERERNRVRSRMRYHRKIRRLAPTADLQDMIMPDGRLVQIAQKIAAGRKGGRSFWKKVTRAEALNRRPDKWDIRDDQDFYSSKGLSEGDRHVPENLPNTRTDRERIEEWGEWADDDE